MIQFDELGINDGVDFISGLYSKIATGAEELVQESYTAVGRTAAFPIDIDLIASHLNIIISKENLNLAGGSNFSRKLAITTSTGNKDVHIAVDDSISYKTRRYAIANGIGRYLLNRSKAKLKNTYAIPLIPQSLEEIAADSIAVFLLMPVTLFKDEFLQYLDSCQEHPMNVDEWLEHLSDTCQITPFNLGIGYQQMKQVLCYQRRTEFEKYDYDVTKMPKDKYDSIFA